MPVQGNAFYGQKCNMGKACRRIFEKNGGICFVRFFWIFSFIPSINVFFTVVRLQTAN